MEKINKLGMIFEQLADELNITEDMLLKAEEAYGALGDYIKSQNEDWDVLVYPQGSFELGTVIKPLNEKEQYDVDLVVLLKSPIFNAQEIREKIKNLLMSFGRYEGKIEDKKPCVRIQYTDASQFHMDVACAKQAKSDDDAIEIARHDGNGTFYYENSNPVGYIEWFKNTMKYYQILEERMVHCAQTEIQDLKLSRIRNSLQKAVQILKRHRDIYFTNKPNADKRPASIIITTLCAMAYEEMDGMFEKGNVYLTVLNMLQQFPKYLKQDSNGEYVLKNPSDTKENFLKKWNEDEALVLAFDEWITKAKKDIITNPDEFIESDQRRFKNLLVESFGATIVERALDNYGKQVGILAESGELRYDTERGNITTQKDKGKEYSKHTYFGGN